MATPMVIIKGRIEREEFKEPFRQWRNMLEKVGIPYHINPATTEEPVDFAIFFQSYPHEFSPSGLKQLRRQNPFAPFFFVLGVCCEGMLRTTGPLDSPFCCYVHGWSGQETEQTRLFLTDQPSVFSLPLTTENDEIALWWADSRRQMADGSKANVPSPPLGERVRVRGGTDKETSSPHPSPLPEGEGMNRETLPVGEGTAEKTLILTHFGHLGNDSAMNQLIADEQERLGHEPVFSGKMLPTHFSGKIFADADDSPRKKILDSIQRLRQQFADNDFTVYVDSPRIDEKTDYLRAGVTQILPKIR